MFASISRSGSNSRTSYICSSCLCNAAVQSSLKSSLAAGFLDHGRTSFFSTSSRPADAAADDRPEPAGDEPNKGRHRSRKERRDRSKARQLELNKALFNVNTSSLLESIPQESRSPKDESNAAVSSSTKLTLSQLRKLEYSSSEHKSALPATTPENSTPLSSSRSEIKSAEEDGALPVVSPTKSTLSRLRKLLLDSSGKENRVGTLLTESDPTSTISKALDQKKQAVEGKPGETGGEDTTLRADSRNSRAKRRALRAKQKLAASEQDVDAEARIQNTKKDAAEALPGSAEEIKETAQKDTKERPKVKPRVAQKPKKKARLIRKISSDQPSHIQAPIGTYRPSFIRKGAVESKTPSQMTQHDLVKLVQTGRLSSEERQNVIKHLRDMLLSSSKPAPDEVASGKSIEAVIAQKREAIEVSMAQELRRKEAIRRQEQPTQGRIRPMMGLRRSSGPAGAGSGGDRESDYVRAPTTIEHDPPGPIALKKIHGGHSDTDMQTVDPDKLHLVPQEPDGIEVPGLAYGLERVLFNPGVYQLQDPRSRVFNFDPYLQTIMPVHEFDFTALKQYITSSKDKNLIRRTVAAKKKYTGSTSSMTSALAHFHYLLSQWRPVNMGNLSRLFPAEHQTFTALNRAPTAIFLRYQEGENGTDGAYAIDADKQYDSASILSMLGKSMEKLLTLKTDEFERYRHANSNEITHEERNAPESFHYTELGDFLMRSQLDAYDPRLPGTGMFDLKTRAVIAVRMDTDAWKQGQGYQIKNRHGEWESYEREYYDMIRSAFLKYSLQVRMGRMDGIFVAFHNTQRIFGFQYISISEMDMAIHGTEDTTIGDAEFKLSIDLLNRALDRATAKWPKQSLRIFFDAQNDAVPYMNIFVEPCSEDRIDKIQSTNRAEIDKFEREILGLVNKDETDEQQSHQLDNDLSKVVKNTISDVLDPQVPATDEREVDSGPHDKEASKPADSVTERQQQEAETCIFSQNELHQESGFPDTSEKAIASETKNVPMEENAESQETGTNDLDTVESLELNDATPDLPTILEVDGTQSKKAAKQDLDDNSIIDEDGNGILKDKEDDDYLLSHDNFLCMTLAIRNKVDGVYVERPENLHAGQKWTVEYALADVNDNNTARGFYRFAKMRRHRALTKSIDLLEDERNTQFLECIKELSLLGKDWRKAQDDLEKDLPLKTLNETNVREHERIRDIWNYEIEKRKKALFSREAKSQIVERVEEDAADKIEDWSVLDDVEESDMKAAEEQATEMTKQIGYAGQEQRRSRH